MAQQQTPRHRKPVNGMHNGADHTDPTAKENLKQDSPQEWLVEHALGDDLLEIETSLPLRISVEDLFIKLRRNADQVTGADLFALSDLARSDAEYVRQYWPELPVVQRRQLLHTFNESSEEQIELAPGQFLRIVLRDEDAEVRRTAIEGLWEDDGEDLIGILLQYVRNDEDAGVQAAAASALGTYVLAGELDEVEPAMAMRVEAMLFEVLEDETQPLEVRCRALESVAYSSDSGLRQLIEDAYYSAYEEMRVSSLRAMGRSADIHWRKLARAELQNPDPAMRAEAAIACGELESQSTIKELIGLLNDDEQIVRLSAIFGLGRLGGKPARDALRAVANSESTEEAEAAEIALDEMLFYDASGITVLDADDENESDDDLDAFDHGDDDFSDDDLGDNLDDADSADDDFDDNESWSDDDDDDLGEYGNDRKK